MTVDQGEGAATDKRMKLRYAGVCRLCGAALPARVEAVYERASRTVRCVDCTGSDVIPGTHAANPIPPAGTVPTQLGPSSPDAGPGVAGASARREYERRKAKDEARIREKWGRLGGIAVALSSERQSTAAWAVGAAGEERLGALLGEISSQRISVLHDRRIPRSTANFDHIVVTTDGVWVIDAKKYRGRPQLGVEGGILRPRVEKVIVGRRDCTRLVDGVLKQVELVRAAIGDVPVIGALCFVAADWPLIGGSFITREVRVLWPKLLAKRLTEADGVIDVDTVRSQLAAQFKPA